MRLLNELSERRAGQLLDDWKFWARPQQLTPSGDWRTWLILAGRGFGKTRAGAEWVRGLVEGPSPLEAGRCRRVALVAQTAADGRDVMVEGESGILAISRTDRRPLYEPSKRRLTWPSGAIATLYNASEPDQLRGPQHDAAWADELAKWPRARDAWDNLQFGLRLGQAPRAVVTTTPRPISVLRDLVAESGTVVTRGSTFDNGMNLAPAFLDAVTSKYGGTCGGADATTENATTENDMIDRIPGAGCVDEVELSGELLDDCLDPRSMYLVAVVVR